MHRSKRLISSLFLSVAMLAPIGAFAIPVPQDAHERQEEMHERRVYDSVHKQYRNWDANEDGAYRRWLEGRHEKYVTYDKLDKKRQSIWLARCFAGFEALRGGLPDALDVKRIKCMECAALGRNISIPLESEPYQPSVVASGP